MSRIKNVFNNNKKAFIAYLTAGDGGFDYTLDACLALAAGGVDILEIGLPFSDPLADGPVIQAAAARALQGGATPHKVLQLVSRLREHTDVPLVLMGYYNPILQLGDSFAEQLASAGVDGILTVDMPLEESLHYRQQCHDNNLDTIMLAAPSTSPERLHAIADASTGFLYYVCRKGTTGIRKAMPADFEDKMTLIKSVSDLPVAAGFGIADRDSAEAALKCADAFVVGSKFVKMIADGAAPSEIERAAREIDPR